MLRCPVCSELLKRERLFIRDNIEDVIYSCYHHGIIFERYEEKNCTDNLKRLAELHNFT